MARLLRSASGLVGVVALGLSLGLVGCSAASEEDTASGGSAASGEEEGSNASGAHKFVSGDYGQVRIVVAGGEIRGLFHAVMNESQGRVCTFAFSGRIDEMDNGHEGALINATDGFPGGGMQGSIRVTAKKTGTSIGPAININFANWPGGCTYASDGADFPEAEPLTDATKIAGFAPVSAEKAYFYDAPNGTRRSAFVVLGDLVVIKKSGDAVVKDGFVQADFRKLDRTGPTTSGWLRYADLASPWATGE